MSSYNLIPVNRLPQPQIISLPEFQILLDAIKQQYLDLEPKFSSVLELDSEPLTIHCRVLAYRELIWHSHFNDVIKSKLLAFATGSDLDHIGVWPYGVERLQNETDESFRNRIQSAPEGLSTAGSRGSYIWHALAVDSNILDVSLQTPSFQRSAIPDDLVNRFPANSFVLKERNNVGVQNAMPGHLAVNLLFKKNVSEEIKLDIISKTQSALNADDVRPINDIPIVREGKVNKYIVDARYELDSGAAAEVILNQAKVDGFAYVNSVFKLGEPVAIGGLYDALWQPGFKRLVIINPSSDIINSKDSASECEQINLLPLTA